MIRSTLKTCLLASLFWTGWTLASPPPEGMLDSRFGVGGIASATFELSDQAFDRTVGMAVDPGGRIYLAVDVAAPVQGTLRRRFGLARFLPGGQLDPGFSGDGLAAPVPNVLASQLMAASGVVVRADGRPLVFGTRYAGGGARGNMLACRYAVAGNLDPGYDGDGCVEPSLALIDNGDEIVYSGAGLPDGRLVLGGYASVNPVNLDHADAMVVMLRADGSIDTGFANSGYRLLQPPGSTFAYIADLLPMSDGRLLAVGTSELGMFIARLTAAGQLDSQFGANGYAQIGFGDLHNLPSPTSWASAAALDAEGRIYLCGRITYNLNDRQSVMAFARLTPGGALDVSYSDDGRIVRPFIDVLPTSNVADCAVDALDRLVVAVQTGTATPGNGDFGLLRLSPDGTPDLGFNFIGQTRVPLDLGGNGVGDERVERLALVGEEILVAGTAYQGNGPFVGPGERHVVLRFGSDRQFADGFEPAP